MESGEAPDGPQGFAAVFSAAVARQQLTLDRLQARLKQAGVPVSAATLSYWQTGRSVPTRRRSLRSLEELERILQLPAGHLVRALPSDDFPPCPSGRLLPAGGQVTDILADLGLDMERRWTGLVDQVLTTIANDRTEASQTSAQLVQSNEAGLDRLPVVFQQDADRPCAPSLTRATGCSIGRVVQVPRERLMVAELLLPRPLARGEMHQVVYRVDWAPTRLASFRTERTLMNRHRVFSATIHFLGMPPLSAARYHHATMPDRPPTAEPGPEANATSIPVAGTTVQSVLLDAEPGVHGISWRW